VTRSLVDTERGLISRRIFHDEAIYAQEKSHIFGRCWLFLAHEDQIPNAGDYITCKMGETPVIVARDQAGGIRALINSCRHRGNQVTRNDAGTAATFTCPYHGWCYDLQGKRVDPGTLVGVPNNESFYAGQLDFSQWGLVPVAQVATYHGLVFGTLDPQAPPLEEYLGDFRWFLDAVLGRGNLSVVPGTVRWQIRTNWKFAADNAVGDNAHGAVAHRSAILTMAKLRDQRAQFARGQEPGFTLLTEYGHGVNCKTGFAPPKDDAPADGFRLRIDPAFERWRNDPEFTAKLSPLQLKIQRFNGNVFPNLFLIDRLLVVRNPIGPHLTEIRAIALFDQNGTPETQLAEKRLAFQKFGPAGLYEQEDGENWDQATSGASIDPLQDEDLNYAMGLGSGTFVNDGQSPSRIDSFVNEYGQMWFYRFWGDAMKAGTWDELRRNHARPEGTL
jgi:phenylpropionate dioxygenase-like ring-hydroxylating dioxygenase large terminal subunit